MRTLTVPRIPGVVNGRGDMLCMLPADSSVPADWIGQKQQQWMRPGTVRR
jgi:hypothetical protein